MKKMLWGGMAALLTAAAFIMTACGNPAGGSGGSGSDGGGEDTSAAGYAVYWGRDAAGNQYSFTLGDDTTVARVVSPASRGRLVAAPPSGIPVVTSGRAERDGHRIRIVPDSGSPVDITLTGTGADAELATVGGQAVTPYHLYLAGYVGNFNNSSYPYFQNAVYWNGKNQVTLPVPSGKKGWAGAIAVKNGKVYVAGCYEDTGSGFGGIGCYWVNGERHDLADGGTDPSNVHRMSIAVTNSGDVYVAGLSASVANAYWKNGQKITVTEAGVTSVYVAAVAASGNDVYLSGSLYTEGETPASIYCYWKNGVKTNLTGGSGGGGTAIAVSGNDVYVLGTNYYWKNTQQVPLPGTNTQAHSIFVDGSDVYVGGYSDDGGNGYWKNGGAKVTFGVTINYIPAVIAAYNGNIYLSATLGGNTPTPGYWINGERVDVYTPPQVLFHGHIMGICIDG